MPSSFDFGPKKVTVVIPNWNGMNWLSDSLRSLEKQDMPAFDTRVIDNGSTDGSLAFIKESYPNIEVVSTIAKGEALSQNGILNLPITHRVAEFRTAD